MTNQIKKLHELRARRKMRTRKKLHGTMDKPRLTVMKSNAHIHVQLIDDDKGHTLCNASTASKESKGKGILGKSKDSARKLGEWIGSLAIKMNIKEIVFDRGPYKYHGILAELADGARSAGLKF